MHRIAHLTIASLFLAGCAAMNADTYTPRNVGPCAKSGGAICNITVRVDSCNSIAVSPEDAQVAPNDAGDVVWRVGPGRWRFASSGIVFRNSHRDFTNPRGGGTSEFRWHNAHNEKHKVHKYKVVVTDGSQTCEVDPSIMN